MLITKYLSLYNQLHDKTHSNRSILVHYLDFFIDALESVDRGYCAILSNGVYHCFYSKGMDSIEGESFSLFTHDIHRDIYPLQDIARYEIVNDVEGFSFLPSTAKDMLSKHFPNSSTSKNQLHLNVFYDNFLYAQIVLFASSSVDAYIDNQSLFFIRNTLEDKLVPGLLRKDQESFDYLLHMTQQIITTKHYHSEDSSRFLARLLDLVFELSNEPDYGSAIIYNSSSWNYVHTIGHDFDSLSHLHIPHEIFGESHILWTSYKEVSPNIFIIDDILNYEMTSMIRSNMPFVQAMEAASMPISKTIQLHIYFNGSLKGILSLDKKKGSKGGFTHHFIHLLKQVNVIGQILFNYSYLNGYTNSFKSLTQLISRLMEHTADEHTSFLHDFLALMVDSIYEADYASVFIRDPDGIHFLDAIGHDLHALQQIPIKSDYFFTYSKGVTLVTNMLEERSQYMPDEINEAINRASRPIKESMISQLQISDDVQLHIVIDIRESSYLNFSNESIQFFETLSNLGFAFLSNRYYIDEIHTLNEELEAKINQRTLELKQSNEKLRSMAHRDSLTQLYNHNRIIHHLEKLIESELTFSIFLFDIDHFKWVNDSYGHPVGDQILVHISNMILSHTHIQGGRYGGEEFLLLLPDMDNHKAVDFCQFFIESIASNDWIPGHPITVSGGVVTYKKGLPFEMIHKADTLLYEAKANGRNRLLYDYC